MNGDIASSGGGGGSCFWCSCMLQRLHMVFDDEK